MEAYYINVKNICYEKEAEFLLSYVSEEKRKKALRFIHKEDRIRTLVGDVLVRTVLCRKFNYKNEDIKYGFNEFRKPYLIGNPEAHFNISHSGDFVAAAFDNEDIGIDIEEVKEMEYEEIVERFFTKEELEWIRSVELKDKLLCFYKLWTLKEAYVKFKGKGMNISFDSFGFKADYKKSLYELNNSNEKVFFNNYEAGDLYELSLCSRKKDMHVEEITYEGLKRLILNYL